MEEQNLTALLQEYDDHTIEGTKPSTSWMSTLLKELRKSNIRRPDIVLLWGPKVLSQQNHIEVWNLHEQLCVAALELGDYEMAQKSIEALQKQFPSSHRVSRLRGMLLEAQENFPEAVAVYESILKADPTNTAARKRKVCIHKAQGDMKQMVDEINQLLYVTPADVGSWVELSELYLTLSDNEAALHCLEELILLDPKNAHYHTRLAEVLYTLGGKENVLLARKHYTISLTNQSAKFNVRALYGLLTCCQALLPTPTPIPSTTDKKKSSSTAAVTATATSTLEDHDTKVNKELYRWGKEQLDTLVSDVANGDDSHVLSFVQKQWLLTTASSEV